MSTAAGTHGRDHSDLVLAYALETLPSTDIPAVEANISACPDCRREFETLRPVIDAFVFWPTDVLRPRVSLWDRLAHRIAPEARAEPESPAPPEWAEPQWDEVAPGISCKLLATDTEHDRVTMLVRLAPGVDYPPHRHAGVEELHLLEGELTVNEKKLYPGDYIRAEAGTVDNRVWSETGCTGVLITSPKDVIR